MKHKEGFTLVELLVVITILVVLLSLLSPALDSAMEAALRVKCAANLHAFGLAHTHYSMDHKRKLLRVVSFHSQSTNSFYPSVSRNKDSQGPGQWSGESIGPYIGGVELNAPVPPGATASFYSGVNAGALGGASPVTGGLYGPQWYCPSNGKTAAKDLGNLLSSLAPGTGSNNNSGWMALDYAYFARAPGTHASLPEQLVEKELVSGKLLMADTIYWWRGGSHTGWWFNHHVEGPSVHDDDRYQWGGPVKKGKEIYGLTGTNQLFGDAAVIWKRGEDFKIDLMMGYSQAVGYVSSQPLGTVDVDVNFY